MDCGQQDTREKAMLTGTGKDMLALLDEAKLNGPKMPSTPSYHSDAGWLQWPDNEAYSFQFMRMLGAAQEGASTVSECFFAARLITPGDDESWYVAWKSVADINNARGVEALARGGLNAATGNWLRASNYYRCAELFMDATDPRREFLFWSMRQCSRLYLEHSRPRARSSEFHTRAAACWKDISSVLPVIARCCRSWSVSVGSTSARTNCFTRCQGARPEIACRFC